MLTMGSQDPTISTVSGLKRAQRGVISLDMQQRQEAG